LTYLVKDILQLVLRQSRALHIFNCTQVLGHAVAVLLPNRLHLLASELLPNTGVIAQIGLGADDQAGNTGAVVVDLREPLFPDVLKGGRGGDGEADQEDISLGVGQRAQAIVILLTGGIEETESVGLITDPIISPKRTRSGCDSSFLVVLLLFFLLVGETRWEHDLHHGHGVVVEHGGDIFGGELVGCVRDEQASLTHSTVADHDTPRRRKIEVSLAGANGGGYGRDEEIASGGHHVATSVRRGQAPSMLLCGIKRGGEEEEGG
jgi:hypothetical protein